MTADRILVVAPHGIGLRDVLLNRALALFLFTRFEVDLISPFTSLRTDEWGIRKHFELGRAPGAQKVLKAINHRAVSTQTRLAFKRFHIETGWSASYRALRIYSSLAPETAIDHERWSRIDRGILGTLLRMATRPFPVLYPQAKLIKNGGYKAVFVTHPTDGECVVLASIARRARTPVICLASGADHLASGGPVMMTPDMLLAWGPEQAVEWDEHHATFRPELKSTELVVTGGLSHDQIVSDDSTQPFNDAYPLIGPSKTIVMFAAYTETSYPGQSETCDTILRSFAESNIDGHLVVRVRPGFDDDMWRRFAAANPDRVTIQTPSGAFFTKWDKTSWVERATEEADVRLYGATLRRSDLVVTAAFSTVFMDAFAAGTPSIAVGIPPLGGNPKGALQKAYRLYGEDLESVARLNFVTTTEQFQEKLKQGYSSEGKDVLLSESGRVYGLQGGVPDGKAGTRAAESIERFLADT